MIVPPGEKTSLRFAPLKGRGTCRQVVEEQRQIAATDGPSSIGQRRKVKKRVVDVRVGRLEPIVAPA